MRGISGFTGDEGEEEDPVEKIIRNHIAKKKAGSMPKGQAGILTGKPSQSGIFTSAKPKPKIETKKKSKPDEKPVEVRRPTTTPPQKPSKRITDPVRVQVVEPVVRDTKPKSTVKQQTPKPVQPKPDSRQKAELRKELLKQGIPASTINKAFIAADKPRDKTSVGRAADALLYGDNSFQKGFNQRVFDAIQALAVSKSSKERNVNEDLMAFGFLGAQDLQNARKKGESEDYWAGVRNRYWDQQPRVRQYISDTSDDKYTPWDAVKDIGRSVRGAASGFAESIGESVEDALNMTPESRAQDAGYNVAGIPSIAAASRPIEVAGRIAEVWGAAAMNPHKIPGDILELGRSTPQMFGMLAEVTSRALSGDLGPAKEALTAIIDSYKQQYGADGAELAKDDPLYPLLDALALGSMGARGIASLRNAATILNNATPNSKPHLLKAVYDGWRASYYPDALVGIDPDARFRSIARKSAEAAGAEPVLLTRSRGVYGRLLQNGFDALSRAVPDKAFAIGMDNRVARRGTMRNQQKHQRYSASIVKEIAKIANPTWKSRVPGVATDAEDAALFWLGQLDPADRNAKGLDTLIESFTALRDAPQKPRDIEFSEALVNAYAYRESIERMLEKSAEKDVKKYAGTKRSLDLLIDYGEHLDQFESIQFEYDKLKSMVAEGKQMNPQLLRQFDELGSMMEEELSQINKIFSELSGDLLSRVNSLEDWERELINPDALVSRGVVSREELDSIFAEGDEFYRRDRDMSAEAEKTRKKLDRLKGSNVRTLSRIIRKDKEVREWVQHIASESGRDFNSVIADVLRDGARSISDVVGEDIAKNLVSVIQSASSKAYRSKQHKSALGRRIRELEDQLASQERELGLLRSGPRAGIAERMARAGEEYLAAEAGAIQPLIDSRRSIWSSKMDASWVDEAIRIDEIRKFDELPDETLVRVFHGTTPENAAKIRESRIAGYMPRGDSVSGISKHKGMYVAPTRKDALNYGKEVVELVVRKGDILPSPESLGKSVGSALFHSYEGAIIKPGVKLEIDGISGGIASIVDPAKARSVIGKLDNPYLGFRTTSPNTERLTSAKSVISERVQRLEDSHEYRVRRSTSDGVAGIVQELSDRLGGMLEGPTKERLKTRIDKLTDYGMRLQRKEIWEELVRKDNLQRNIDALESAKRKGLVSDDGPTHGGLASALAAMDALSDFSDNLIIERHAAPDIQAKIAVNARNIQKRRAQLRDPNVSELERRRIVEEISELNTNRGELLAIIEQRRDDMLAQLDSRRQLVPGWLGLGGKGAYTPHVGRATTAAGGMGAVFGDEMMATGNRAALRLTKRNKLRRIQSGNLLVDAKLLNQHVNNSIAIAATDDLRDFLIQNGRAGTRSDTLTDLNTKYYAIKLRGSQIDKYHRLVDAPDDESFRAQLEATIREEIVQSWDGGTMDKFYEDPSSYVLVDRDFANKVVRHHTGGRSSKFFRTEPSTMEKAWTNFDLVTNIAKYGMLYFNPGYFPANVLGNIALNIFHQGIMAGPNLAKAMGGKWSDVYHLMDPEIGEGVFASQFMDSSTAGARKFSSEYFVDKTKRGAQHVSKITDRAFRRSSYIKELANHGIRTPDDYKAYHSAAMQGDQVALMKLASVSDRTQSIMLDFDSLTPLEKSIIRRLIFLYPYTRASAVWAGKTLVDYPERTAIAAGVARAAHEEAEERLGNIELPSWLRGAWPIKKNGNKLLLTNFAFMSPLQTVTDLVAIGNTFAAATIGRSMDDEEVSRFHVIADLINPLYNDALNLGSLENQYGQFTGIDEPGMSFLRKVVPLLSYFSPGKISNVYADRTWSDTALRRGLRAYPFEIKITASRASEEREKLPSDGPKAEEREFLKWKAKAEILYSTEGGGIPQEILRAATSKKFYAFLQNDLKKTSGLTSLPENTKAAILTAAAKASLVSWGQDPKQVDEGASLLEEAKNTTDPVEKRFFYSRYRSYIETLLGWDTLESENERINLEVLSKGITDEQIEERAGLNGR